MELLSPHLLLYIATGSVVGLAVGLTGVGGGSLMTPLLLLFGFPPQTAIGTDLLYAAITKSSGMAMHARRSNVDWTIVGRMAAGSLPAAGLTALLLGTLFSGALQYRALLTTSLGVMLILTAAVLLLRTRLQRLALDGRSRLAALQKHTALWTLITGAALGCLVTLSSVGAGAIGTALLLILYPQLKSIRVVGTDLAHAVPLTLAAGLGHLALGHVNYPLLAALLIGSLPAIYIGTQLGNRLPDRLLQPILVTVLLGLGVKYALL
ncbi:MAG: sulfite exporter TauE/SafE family protein [Alcanivorax sp.]|nr:sulfite exporter TauE/SafE family protein [Alcanivorax sp.]